jgi:hypothetical protein
VTKAETGPVNSLRGRSLFMKHKVIHLVQE